MKTKSTKPRRRKIVAESKVCPFCEAKTDPTFTNVESLHRSITDRGKIIGRVRSGVCAKHQRRLSFAIKHARHLALLPFVVSV